MNSNNKVELIGYYGGDRTSVSPHLTPEQIENHNTRLETLKRLIERDELDSLKLSSIHFQFQLDLVTYYFIINNYNVTYIEHDNTEDYYIPNEFCNQKITEDVYDNEGNLFLKKGQNFFDAIYNFTELSKNLQNRLIEDTKNITPPLRTNHTRNYFTPFNNLKKIDIIFNCKELMRFIKDSNKSEISIEIKELTYDMVEQIKTIYKTPFTSTLTAFELQ